VLELTKFRYFLNKLTNFVTYFSKQHNNKKNIKDNDNIFGKK